MIVTTQEQICEWLAAPEGATYEFKEAKNKYSYDKLVEYCVALANMGGGKILLGVTDKRPRTVVGTAAFTEPGHAEAVIYDRLSHRVPVEELFLDGKRLLVVHVPSRLKGTAWNIEGRYLKRAGDALVPLGDVELRAIFAETGPDFSAEICPKAKIEDLFPWNIGSFRSRWAKKTGDTRKLLWTDQETLENAELVVQGGITYAALILLAFPSSLSRLLPQAELIFEYRANDGSGPAADREEFRQGFISWEDAIWKRINLRNNRQSYQDGLFRFDLPTFDEVSVRESLLNAVAHRDYRLGGSVFVRQYPHRLEVVSPGGLPDGITPQNILDQQNPRNRRLAEALGKCGFIERSGQGINLMFESAIKQGKPLPDFAGTSTHEVRLTMEGLVKNTAIVRFMERLGEERLQSLSTYDFLALDVIQREQTLPDNLRARLPTLVQLGAIETIGRGKGTRYILSRKFHEAIGAKGTYTRKKGLDRETNKALLETHLLATGMTGAPLSELQQVLPAQTQSHVQTLLNELKEEKRVILKGKRRWARWYAAKANIIATSKSL